MNFTNKTQIFISYRREDGIYPAILLHKELVQNGFEVFFDINSLRNGKFDDQIYEKIQECQDFILIVTKTTFLPRILDGDDWIRRELSLATALKKNIIPVFIGDAIMPHQDELPEDIRDVVYFNALRQQDANLIQEVNQKLISNYITAKASHLTANTYLSRRCSAYDPNFGNEETRLQVQANNLLE